MQSVKFLLGRVTSKLSMLYWSEPTHTHKHILFSITHDGLMGLWSMEALSLSLSSLHKIFCIDVGFVISLLMQIEIINDDDDDQCWYL